MTSTKGVFVLWFLVGVGSFLQEPRARDGDSARPRRRLGSTGPRRKLFRRKEGTDHDVFVVQVLTADGKRFFVEVRP